MRPFKGLSGEVLHVIRGREMSTAEVIREMHARGSQRSRQSIGNAVSDLVKEGVLERVAQPSYHVTVYRCAERHPIDVALGLVPIVTKAARVVRMSA